MAISERTFSLALDYIQSGGYEGPVAMACDDTKLHPALRTYWDPELKAHFLVGHVGEPYRLANAEELKEILQTKSKQPGTKVRSDILGPSL